VPTNRKHKHKLCIHSITLCDITIQIVTHRVDWFSCLAFVLLQYLFCTAAKSYILNHMRTAPNFIIEGRSYGRRLLLQTWGCLHFRTVPQELWLINKDSSRCARDYNKENQTRPFHSTRSVKPTRIVFTHGFINISLIKCAVTSTCIINAQQYHKQGLIQVLGM